MALLILLVCALILTVCFINRVKQSQELISSDIHAGTADFKFTYSVELLPICKVRLPDPSGFATLTDTFHRTIWFA